MAQDYVSEIQFRMHALINNNILHTNISVQLTCQWWLGNSISGGYLPDNVVL